MAECTPWRCSSRRPPRRGGDSRRSPGRREAPDGRASRSWRRRRRSRDGRSRDHAARRAAGRACSRRPGRPRHWEAAGRRSRGRVFAQNNHRTRRAPREAEYCPSFTLVERPAPQGGRCMDNIIVERLWRSLKYEAIYLHGIADGLTAGRLIGEWVRFLQPLEAARCAGRENPGLGTPRGDTCGFDGQAASHLSHIPTDAAATTERSFERDSGGLRNNRNTP